MKRTILVFLPLLCSSSFTFAQIKVLPGTSVTVKSGTELSSAGVSVEPGSNVDVPGTLRITGDESWLTNRGALEIGGQLAMETPAGHQSIGGEEPFNVGTLRVNAPDGGVRINNELTIQDSAMLQHGIVLVDTATPLHFGINALTPAERSGSHIEGRAIMDARQVGSGALPMFLGCGITAGADLGSVTLVRTTGPGGIVTEGDHSSIAANWAIRTTANPDIPNRHITFFWLPEFDNYKDINNMDLYGSPLGTDNYEKLNNASVAVPGSNVRVYTQHRVARFNQIFTLSDRWNPLTEPAVGQRIVRVFPNPFVEKITVDIENTRNYPVVARMISATGKIVYQATAQPVNNSITLDNLGYLPQGNYWLHLYTHGSNVSTHVIKIGE